MDFRSQQPEEHDFTYAARILKAAGTSFEAMLVNGSFTRAEVCDLRTRILCIVAKHLDPLLSVGPDKEKE